MQFASRALSLSVPRIMGVLNVTPDSFFDGGTLCRGSNVDLDAAMRRVESMVSAGADFIDVGGESTRPGAAAVSSAQELDRVVGIVDAIAQRFDVVISLDTSNPDVMRAGVLAGAGLINDVRALERPNAIEVAAELAVPVCLMHMKGRPETMQNAPCYDSVVNEVRSYLLERVGACLSAGIAKNQVIVDPGIGFGKSDEHNVELLRSLGELTLQELPLLVGVSRKSMIGRLLGRELGERMPGSLAFAYAALLGGASILRVHDVAETADIVRVHQLMKMGL